MPTLFLARLRTAGVRLWVDAAGKPRLEPASTLTPEDWEQIRQHREALLDELWHEQKPLCEVSFRYASTPEGWTLDTITGQVHRWMGGTGDEY